jgi:WD40 repeat protein
MSPDGGRVAVSSPSGIELIDVRSGRASQPPLSPGSLDRAAFSPDGRTILIGGIDGKLHLLDVTTEAEVWSRDFGGEPVVAALWSGDGRLVSARTLLGEVRILDAATGGDVLGPLPGVANIDFSPAGGTIVAAGTELRILDARTGETQRDFAGVGGLYAAAFIRGGRWVSAMTGSGLVELFDVSSGARIGVPLRIARDTVSDANNAVLRPDGLYWGRPDGPVVYYDLDPASWESIACGAAGRNLTRAEWENYLGAVGEYRATCSQYPAGS